MNCNGKCVLMKKILAEQRKEQKNPELKIENKFEVFLVADYFQNRDNFGENIKNFLPLPFIGQVVDRSSYIFHPLLFLRYYLLY